MNKGRILALANLVETLPQGNYYDDKEGFDMSVFTHECGTPACIAGWAAWLSLGMPADLNASVDMHDTPVRTEAKEYLDIGYGDAEGLFHPNVNKSWSSITPQEGAKVLRHFAETGEVDWTIIEENIE